MDLGRRGWDQTPTVRAYLQMLDVLFDNHVAGEQVELGSAFVGQDAQSSERTRMGLRQLDAEGFNDLHETYDDSDISCTLRIAGAAFTESVWSQRSKVGVRQAARDAYLYWLYDVGGSPRRSDFLQDPRSWFFGIHFTGSQIREAVIWLLDARFVVNQGRDVGDGSVRVSISAAGTRVVESDGSVNSSTQQVRGSVTNYNVNGDGNAFQHGSPGAIQNVTTNISTDHRHLALQFADRLQAALPGLDLAGEDEGLPDDIRDATEADKPRLLRRVIEAAATALASSAGSALAAPLISDAHALLGSLPS